MISLRLIIIGVVFNTATTFLFAQVPNYVPSANLIAWYPFNSNSDDESGNNNHLTNNGPTLTVDRFGHCNSAYYFSQNQDLYKSTPNTNGSTFTWSFWMNKINSNTDSHGIAESNNASTTGGGFDCTSNTPQFICQGVSGNVTNSTTTITNGIWYHYAVTKNGSDFSIYINGVLNSNGTSSYLSYDVTTWLKIGAGVNLAEAEIDDVGMWNAVLSPTEITALYNATSPNAGTTVTQSGATLTADQTGATYQWLDCNDNYSEISGETNQTYTPTPITGNYAVEVTANGCSDTSACFLVDYTGLNEQTDLNILLFPNPVNNSLFIQSNCAGVHEIYISDLSGRIVKKILSETNSAEIDMTTLVPGVYYIRVLKDNNFFVTTIIKN